MRSILLTAFTVASLVLSAPLESREEKVPYLSTACKHRLSSLGFGPKAKPPYNFGVNALEPSNPAGRGVWIGDGAPYDVLFSNNYTEEVCLVIWGDKPKYQAMFPKKFQPLITVSLPPHSSNMTISFANGTSGAWAGVYPNTTTNSIGMISNTWGEYTFAPEGVVDISREVHTHGMGMTIEGPHCKTDMDTCVFKCYDESLPDCGDVGTYHLVNCTPANPQPGAVDNDMLHVDGGCGWMGDESAHFNATFH